MSLYRKSRRLLFFIHQHYFTIIPLVTILIFAFIFRKEIIYHIYIQTLDMRPYEKSLTIWSTDFHVSPIHDLKSLLIPLGVKFFDKSLSYSCERTSTCYSPLRILNRRNGMSPSNEIASEFYDFYRNQIEMNAVDAYVCFHPAGMCELYMPFNRSILVIASTRYELGRFQAVQWRRLNENLIKIARDPKNVIAANNLYDAEYIRYFTGINVTVLPSLCNYTNAHYNPIRKEFLLINSHMRQFDGLFMRLLELSLTHHKAYDLQIVPIRKMYHSYKYSDLTHHPAIIHIPYQVSVMSLFEQYRMNIPLLFPSLDLLTRWHQENGLVSEKTWHQALYATLPRSSVIEGVLPNVPDPNDDRNQTSIRYWLNFSDFYQWPHITYYESTDDLVQKLRSTNFEMISKKMKEYNKEVTDRLLDKWAHILDKIKRHSKKFQHVDP